MTVYKELEKDVLKAVDDLFKKYGPESAVIVMVGIPDRKEHSAFQFAWDGRCLPVEGLLRRVSRELQEDLWRGK